MSEKQNRRYEKLLPVSGFILKMRYVFFALFTLACIFCGITLGWTKTNSDITTFLPAETETRRGLDVMEREFVTYANAYILVEGTTFTETLGLVDMIRWYEHVASVEFDASSAHVNKDKCLISVSFDGPADDPDVVDTMSRVRRMLERYPKETHVQSEIGVDYSEKIASEMVGVVLISAIVIVGVLLLTSKTFFEIFVFFIVFIVAAILNMGTNYWCGTISSITNSTAIILQLALAIDYAIIFAHRYQDELPFHNEEKEALRYALAKSILEVSSSSLTTISGLVALMLMQFRLGRDLGIVLAKGILCSLLTVLLLMPGLLMLFRRALAKTKHRNLVPSMKGWGSFLMKSKGAFVVLFLVMLPFVIYGSNRSPFAFHHNMVDELVQSEERDTMRKIAENFNNTTAVALLVPSGHYEYESAIISELEEEEKIVNIVGLAGIEFGEYGKLTDLVTAEEFANRLHISVAETQLLFQGYALEHMKIGALFGNKNAYPFVDLILYLFEKIDAGRVVLSESQKEMLNEYRPMLERATNQLKGKRWNRIACTVSLPAESEESVELVEKMRTIAEKKYGEGKVLVVGNITSARDLKTSFRGDSTLITVFTVLFVFLILMVTFRSVVGSLLMVFVIQGSIWMNFAIPYLTGRKASFVTYMIVSAIQMGATIDYAIVLMNRYRALRNEGGLEKKEAMVQAVNDSFPTVMTSGVIMAVAGLLIAYRVSDVYIGHIGLAVGRGAIISMLMVMTVLPQLLVLCDRAIEATTIKMRSKKEKN